MSAIAFLQPTHWLGGHYPVAAMASSYRLKICLAVTPGNVVFGLFVSGVGK